MVIEKMGNYLEMKSYPLFHIPYYYYDLYKFILK